MFVCVYMSNGLDVCCGRRGTRRVIGGVKEFDSQSEQEEAGCAFVRVM